MGQKMHVNPDSKEANYWDYVKGTQEPINYANMGKCEHEQNSNVSCLKHIKYLNP